MSRRVVRHDAAQQDLAGHARYIAQDNTRAAQRFLRAAENAFERLAGLPLMGTRCEFRNPSAADLRYWLIQGFRKYVIIYRPLDDGIEAVRVVHASQNWQAIFES